MNILYKIMFPDMIGSFDFKQEGKERKYRIKKSLTKTNILLY